MIKLFKYLLCTFFMLSNVQFATAQINNALVLDGCTNYLEISDNDLLDYNQILSIECWIKPNCEDGNNIILSKQWCQGEYGYYLSVNNGRLFWSYQNSGFCGQPNTYQSVNPEILFDKFTHVAVVHSSSEIKLFIDGKEIDTEQNQGIQGGIKNSSEPFRIGAYKNVSGSMTNHFSGLIDEVRLWDIALNEQLIQQRKDSPLLGDEVGLVLYLNMEQSGQGESLILENQSTYGSIFNAISTGFSMNLPYTINPFDYERSIIDLGGDITLCSFPISLSIPQDNYKSILWSNGSNDTEIEILNPGEYSVIIETELCKFHTETININLTEETYVYQEYSICENDTITINNITYYEEGVYLDTISNLTFSCDTIIENTIVFENPSTNYIQIATCPNTVLTYQGEEIESGNSASFLFTNSQGCDSTVLVENVPSLVLFENINYSVCQGDFISYQGINLLPGSSTEFNYTSEEGCDSIVTVFVNLIPTDNSYLGNDTIICDSEYIISSPALNTLWNNGIESSSYNVNSSGTYNALFIDSLGCINFDTIEIIFIENNIFVPNVFTPNNNGNNDCIKPFFSTGLDSDFYKFIIYNRWGEKIFETIDPNVCWKGEYKGKSLNSGVFIWVLELYNSTCNNFELLRGDITLLK